MGPSPEVRALQRSLKEALERADQLSGDVQDERAAAAKLRGRLAQREDEHRASVHATTAAATKRVRPARFLHACCAPRERARCHCHRHQAGAPRLLPGYLLRNKRCALT